MEWTLDLFYNFDIDEELAEQDSSKKILTSNLEEMDFGTFNPILNMGGIFSLMVMYLVQMGLVLLIIIFVKLQKSWMKDNVRSREHCCYVFHKAI